MLQRQFEKSHFAQTHPTKQVKKLAIFDFDSTLFFSPLLSPTIWHPNLIQLATAESVYGPGWWRDIRSLDLGPFKDLQSTAWKGYWNEKIVNEARHCIADEDTMTVVLTGRRHHPFHHLIPAMLESKGLQFDLVGLRPDPEAVSEYHWEGVDSTQVGYNLTGSVFKSTMHFKTCFILNILHEIPSLKKVVMWDDRFFHVKRFKEYLDAVKASAMIEDGRVVYVPGIRPVYNPDWEKRVIAHIIDTHNKALLELRHEGKKNGRITERLLWNQQPEDPLPAAKEKLLQLSTLPAQTVIALSASCIANLRQSFASLFQSQLDRNKHSKWKVLGGEKPQFFGDYVYLSQSVIPSALIPVGPVGTQVNVDIISHSVSPGIPCFLLQAKVQGSQEIYILPLWYKPSEFLDVFRLNNFRWQPIRPSNRTLVTHVQGKVNYAYRLGVIETSLHKRPASQDLSPIPSRLRTN